MHMFSLTHFIQSLYVIFHLCFLNAFYMLFRAYVTLHYCDLLTHLLDSGVFEDKIRSSSIYSQ